MHIQFQRSGGFAAPAMRQAIRIDTDSLPDEEANQVKALVRAADISSLAARPKAKSPTRPDMFFYRLVVEDAGQQYTVEVSETEMPASLRPLVQWLSKGPSSS